MSREIWMAGSPGANAGANSEMLHTIDLLRQHQVAIHIVPMFEIDSNAKAWAESVGCHIHEYSTEIFRDKLVASFNNGRFLARLPEIMKAAPPRTVLWFNTMAVGCHYFERACHAAGWLHLHGFASRFQREKLTAILSPLKPVREFAGYRQYFNPDNALQPVKFEYREPVGEFVVGRISRGDPLKFSPDTWKMFGSVDTGTKAKLVRILGFSIKVQETIRLPPSSMRCNLLRPGEEATGKFLSSLHCMIHRTGGSMESYCRVVPEAMAAGVPVIVERNYAFPEMITDGETGFLCDTWEEMAERATELARDESLRKRIIFNAEEFRRTQLQETGKCWDSWQRLLSGGFDE